MTKYLFKFDEPYEEGDNDIFAKGCLEKNNNFIPILINFDYAKIIGQIRLDFDEVGVFCKENENNLKIGFVASQISIKDNLRIIEKCEIFCLSVLQ